MNFYSLVSTLLLLSGCQTFQAPERAGFGRDFKAHFASCPKSEGGVTLSIQAEGVPMGSLGYDWIMRSSDSWDAEVYNALGQSLLGVKRRNASLRFSGQLRDTLKPLGRTERGYYSWGGESTYLREQELMCLLSGQLPVEWLKFERKVHRDGQVELRDGERHINLKRRDSWPMCGSVSVPFLWFFELERYRWCFDPASGRGFFAVRDFLHIDWEDADNLAS